MYFLIFYTNIFVSATKLLQSIQLQKFFLLEIGKNRLNQFNKIHFLNIKTKNKKIYVNELYVKRQRI